MVLFALEKPPATAGLIASLGLQGLRGESNFRAPHHSFPWEGLSARIPAPRPQSVVAAASALLAVSLCLWKNVQEWTLWKNFVNDYRSSRFHCSC